METLKVGLHGTEVAILLLTSCLKFDSQHYQNINFHADETDQRSWLEESGQSLDNVDQIHELLAS